MINTDQMIAGEPPGAPSSKKAPGAVLSPRQMARALPGRSAGIQRFATGTGFPAALLPFDAAHNDCDLNVTRWFDNGFHKEGRYGAQVDFIITIC